MRTIVAEESLFSFPKLKLFTDNTFNTLVRLEEELPTTLSTLFVTYPKIEDDSDQLSLSFSNNDSPPLWKLTRIRHEPIRYGLVAQYIALWSVAQCEICESLSYIKVIWSLKAHLWKQAKDKEVSSLYENYTWDLLDPPANTSILKGKWVYKLKYNIDRLISHYKACWIAKSF